MRFECCGLCKHSHQPPDFLAEALNKHFGQESQIWLVCDEHGTVVHAEIAACDFYDEDVEMKTEAS